MVAVHIVLMREHDRHAAVADFRREQDDLLVLAADRTLRTLEEVERATENLLALAEQSAAHLHVGVRAAAALADDVVEVDDALAIAEVEAPDIGLGVVAG